MFKLAYAKFLRGLVTVLLLSSVLTIIPSAIGQQSTTTTSFLTSTSAWTTTFASESTQSYSTSLTLSGPIGNVVQPGSGGAQVTCAFTGLPFEAQQGQVVNGTVHPGPIGVILGIMDATTYGSFSGSSSSESCIELMAPYSGNLTSYVDSNNVFHFRWQAPATGPYYFVILNAGYAGSVPVQFTASAPENAVITSTGYQAQTSQILQTLPLASSTAASSSLQTQPPQPTPTSGLNPEYLIPLTIIVIIALALAAFNKKNKRQNNQG